MRFRLLEGKDPTEILEDVQEEHKEQQEILKEVRDLLLDEEFEEEKKLNGVSFNKTINIGENTIRAQFYVDTTTFNYSSYVQSDTEIGDTNFSSKGGIEGIISAAKRLVFELNGI